MLAPRRRGTPIGVLELIERKEKGHGEDKKGAAGPRLKGEQKGSAYSMMVISAIEANSCPCCSERPVKRR